MGKSKREKKSKSRGKWGPEFHASLESKVLEFQQSKARDRDFVFQDVVNMLDRFLNNLSRRISTAKKQRVSQDELLEYIEVIVREIVEEQMVKLKKSGAK